MENFCQRGIHSDCQVILLDFSDTDLSIIINSRGWGSLCDIVVTCPSMIIETFYSFMHEIDISVPHFFSHVRGTRIVAHPDYPSYARLRTITKDKLSSLFCETPLSWDDHQNTLCSGFAKGQRFLNMVMIFILHPLSQYNSITEPRAQFLLSLLEDISIDFPSHFILSLMDIYRDTTTYDKLIFPSAIMRILCHFSVSFPKFPHFLMMCATDADTIRWSEAQLRPRQPRTNMAIPSTSTTPSTSAPSFSAGGVT